MVLAFSGGILYVWYVDLSRPNRMRHKNYTSAFENIQLRITKQLRTVVNQLNQSVSYVFSWG